MRSSARTNALTTAPLSIGQQVALSCLWLPYYMQWGALLSIVWPSQIGIIAGDRKELWNGTIIGLGALVALFVPPIAGALSDASTHPRGRRWPYLVWGGLLNVAFLLFLGTLGAGSNLGLFVLGSLGLQFACNWWGGPYAGLIPDIVTPERRGLASGYMMLMMVAGYGAGAAAAGVLTREGAYGLIYTVLAAALVLALGFTLWGIREPAPMPFTRQIDWRVTARAFFPPLHLYSDFYWVLATRMIVGMGMWAVSTYILYYLKDVVHIENPEQLGAILFLVGGAIGVPVGLYAGNLSDRLGRKGLVYLSGGLMAVSSLLYASGAAKPEIWIIWTSAILFGVGNSIYSSVDWAFALDALPEQRNAGKDMGIWHASMVLPQVLAMPISAILLNELKPVSLPFAYVMLFGLSAFWFGLGTLLVRQVRGLR